MDGPSDVHAVMLSAKLDALAANVASMQAAISEMGKTLITLVRVEERQIDQDEALKAGLMRIDDHDARLRHIESKLPSLIEIRAWAGSVVVSVLGAVAYAVMSGHLH